MKLFFDTETTGLPNFKLPPGDCTQPKVVQLAAILTDQLGNELSSINLIIKPIDENGNGFEIPEEVSKIHGITTEKALTYGVEMINALGIFCSLKSNSNIVIGHNVEFDLFILMGELLRYECSWLNSLKNTFCTMRNLTDICKIPHKNGKSGYKWPTLQEAYRHAFNKEFEGAHDAMQDIRATKDLYFWLIKNAGV